MSLLVSYSNGQDVLDVGRLAYMNRKFYFEYTQAFLEGGLELSPFKLPLKPGVHTCEEWVFEGLFGLFNDSLPDGWGRLLIDRKLMNLGINPNTLSPLDRLKYVGTRGMGALRYTPEIITGEPSKGPIELDEIQEECLQFQEHNDLEYIDDLLWMNGSSAGARPKVLVSFNKDFHSSDNLTTHLHSDWIVKFRSSLDPEDIGPIEFAYHLMAKKAGLVVPEAKLFKARKGPGYFGVKRFDRNEKSFYHMQTLSGLLHADHRIPSLDYEAVMKATFILTRDAHACGVQLRNAAFNVFSHNRDDHAKNFSFLMNAKGVWNVSPAYDLTFSSGPAGEHCTTVMGNGKNPGESDLLKLARIGNIEEKKARIILDEVRSAVFNWRSFASEAGVSKASLERIEKVINK